MTHSDPAYGCALKPEMRANFSHRAISRLTSPLNSPGELEGVTSEPSAANRAWSAESLNACLTLSCRVPTSAGLSAPGATSPYQPFNSNPGKPDSAIVGNSGKNLDRLA